MKGENFVWNSIATNIGPDNIDLFKTIGKLKVEDCKNHCDLKWTGSLTATNLQFCTKSNMKWVFIKNISHQSILTKIKEERPHLKITSGGDEITFLIFVYNKNSHGRRVSVVVVKTKLLSIKTKDFQHNILDVNRFFLLKEKEVAFCGETNPDVHFQLFQIYESCTVSKFQEVIGKIRRKWNRRDDLITK